jgi:hypothetical protein
MAHQGAGSLETQNEIGATVNEAAIKSLVDEQADDDGLWFHADTAAEAYVQQALRRLHSVIEGKTPNQCAVEVLTATEIK